jgi:hypothetical protein
MLYRLPSPEWLTALLIHVVVPAAGIWLYVRCRREGQSAGAPPRFALYVFVLFFVWGGVLLITLTSLFWYWSGMASLGIFFLLFASPLFMIPVVIGLWHMRAQFRPARLASAAALLYYIVVVVALILFIGPWGKG